MIRTGITKTRSNQAAYTFCLLLTASIDPKNCAFLKRSDPKIREKDYLNALKKWIDKTKYPIVFCENSGFDISQINKTAEEGRKLGREIEVIQFDGNNYPRNFGKGFGEMLIIGHAMCHSKLIQKSKYIIKVTGRFFVSNINSIVGGLTQANDLFAITSCREKELVPSVFFCGTTVFFTKCLLPWQHKLNDQTGFYFEHALKQACDTAQKEGFKCFEFDKPILLCGYRGTDNKLIYGFSEWEASVRVKLKKVVPQPVFEFFRSLLSFFKKN